MFHMTIRKRKSISLAMPSGRKILPPTGVINI